MNICSFFSGAGGLDLGFKQYGFNIIYANEFDKKIWDTYEHNHPETFLEKKSISDITSNNVPDCDGIIGGPPCQSWSIGGANRGINDIRGKLFFNYIDIIKDKQPKFFLAENVEGILNKTHKQSYERILRTFDDIGYDVFVKLLNAVDYGVPQVRKRAIFIGFRKDLKIDYKFPKPYTVKFTLKDCIKDLDQNSVPSLSGNKANPKTVIDNHEFFTSDFSSMYMSRNRVRSWDEPSFTILASARHVPIHPRYPTMIKISRDKREFVAGYKYTRLTVRECARIQTFPDSFKFIYSDVAMGYKMVGNAVPVNLAYELAKSIKEVLK